MSRWKSSVGSPASESSSCFSILSFDISSGISDTTPSNFCINLERFVDAVEARERREAVRLATMGATRYVDVPYRSREREENRYSVVKRRGFVISGVGCAGVVRNSGYVMMGGCEGVELV